MDGKGPEISLIIPAYNEGDRIGASLRRVSEFIDRYDRTVEVLIVDDGSRDKTAEVVTYFIEEFRPDSSFSLLDYGGNRGKGYAVAYGFRRARGRYLVFSDTDLSAPIGQIPLLIDSLEAGADLAIGSRRLSGSQVEGLPVRRKIMGWFFAHLSKWLLSLDYADTQCGFKAYRREAAEKLIANQTIEGYTFDVEHLLSAKRLGLKVEEVPIHWIYTEGSQVNGLSDSWKMFKDLLALRKRVGERR
jgi:glycosyltransferase involved in cell wall biosynthesis